MGCSNTVGETHLDHELVSIFSWKLFVTLQNNTMHFWFSKKSWFYNTSIIIWCNAQIPWAMDVFIYPHLGNNKTTRHGLQRRGGTTKELQMVSTGLVGSNGGGFPACLGYPPGNQHIPPWENGWFIWWIIYIYIYDLYDGKWINGWLSLHMGVCKKNGYPQMDDL